MKQGPLLLQDAPLLSLHGRPTYDWPDLDASLRGSRNGVSANGPCITQHLTMAAGASPHGRNGFVNEIFVLGQDSRVPYLRQRGDPPE